MKTVAYVGFMPRLIALIVDTLLLYIPSILAYVLFLNWMKNTLGELALVYGLYLLVTITQLYYIFCIGRIGQTFAKKLFNLQVVDTATYHPPGLMRAFMRETIGKHIFLIIYIMISNVSLGMNTIKTISVLLAMGYPIIDYAWVLWDTKKQTLHDKIAGTVMIHS